VEAWTGEKENRQKPLILLAAHKGDELAPGLIDSIFSGYLAATPNETLLRYVQVADMLSVRLSHIQLDSASLDLQGYTKILD
jgi:hypothetical protein